ncbi:LysR family transcriptional regulator [Paraburkholderia bryophila]|uniref:DNA-binding transcriptional LysR family regulator n=1 Tax=Paraburkholderia bryophila TaxID=420952 RepID=A0A7Y9WHX7_9BURK|nr:LysR family transcriptional regulator [Paraburkholderia bryophila]NYH19803.1 DNA-binding transcriptional LysR family regulator [Paraburkholderia bryophila]NYH21149.1 DNA-binding transcriptional LysR family regulator [Paraburkholderia bryophila]
MRDRLSGIAAFVNAAEAGSFALAAERMHLSRSAVGKTIARLEEQLGTRLFHRTTRSQSLTEDGHAFYERCVRALAELDAGEATLTAGRQDPQGRLHVSMPVLFGRRCVAPILLELAQRYPKLELQISFTDRVMDLVEEGIDLVVRGGPLNRAPAGLVARRLGEQIMALCAAPTYLAKNGTPGTVADLQRHQGIFYARGRREAAWQLPDEQDVLQNIVIPHRLRFDDLETILAATVAGAGIACLPCWLIADAMASGVLAKVLPALPGQRIDLHLAWQQTRHLPSRMRVVIDELAARVPAVLAEGIVDKS